MKINKLPQISQVILFWKLIGSFTTLRSQLKKKKKKQKKIKKKKKKKKKKKQKKKNKTKQNKTKFCT